MWVTVSPAVDAGYRLFSESESLQTAVHPEDNGWIYTESLMENLLLAAPNAFEVVRYLAKIIRYMNELDGGVSDASKEAKKKDSWM